MTLTLKTLPMTRMKAEMKSNFLKTTRMSRKTALAALYEAQRQKSVNGGAALNVTVEGLVLGEDTGTLYYSGTFYCSFPDRIATRARLMEIFGRIFNGDITITISIRRLPLLTTSA